MARQIVEKTASYQHVRTRKYTNNIDNQLDPTIMVY